MCTPITSQSGNVQSPLPSCKRVRGKKPGEHNSYLGKAVHGEILSRRVLTYPPPRACAHQQHTHIASAVSRNSWLQIKALPQSVCSACPGCRRTSEQSVHSHNDFWASPFTEITEVFTVATTWTCSWEKPHQKSLLCCTRAFLSKVSRGQNPRSGTKQTRKTPCCTCGCINQHFPNQLLIP